MYVHVLYLYVSPYSYKTLYMYVNLEWFFVAVYPATTASRSSLKSLSSQKSQAQPIPSSKSWPVSQRSEATKQTSSQPSKPLKRSLSIKDRLRLLKENLLFGKELRYCKKHKDMNRMNSLRMSIRSGQNPFSKHSVDKENFTRQKTVHNRPPRRDPNDRDVVDRRPAAPTPRPRSTYIESEPELIENFEPKPQNADSDRRLQAVNSRPQTPELEPVSRPVTPVSRSRPNTPSISVRIKSSDSEDDGAQLVRTAGRPPAQHQLTNYRDRLSSSRQSGRQATQL